MKKVILEISGMLTFLIGFVLMANYLSGITGYAISNRIGVEFSSIAGIVFIIGGLALFIAGRHQRDSNVVFVNQKKGVRKIKFALTTHSLNYDKLKLLTKEAGYKFVEAKEYAAVFSPQDEIVKNGYGYPIIIPYDKKGDKELLRRVAKGIVEDYEKA
jgi:hypothetical protein